MGMIRTGVESERDRNRYRLWDRERESISERETDVESMSERERDRYSVWDREIQRVWLRKKQI